MTRNKGTIFLIVMLLLTGCSSLLTSKQNVDQFYTVNAVNYQPENKQTVDYTIVVELPTIAKGLDDNKIMLMHSPQRLDYYAYARWTDVLSKLVQTSIVESFENSAVLERVASSDQGGIQPDYILLLEVYDFQAEYTVDDEAPVVHIKLVAKLVDYLQRDLAASFTVESSQEVAENNIEDIMQAFDQTFAGVQRMLIEETVDYFAG